MTHIPPSTLETFIEAKGAELADWFLKLRAEGKSPAECGAFMGEIIKRTVAKIPPEYRDAMRDKLTDAMHEAVQLTKTSK